VSYSSGRVPGLGIRSVSGLIDGLGRGPEPINGVKHGPGSINGMRPVLEIDTKPYRDLNLSSNSDPDWTVLWFETHPTNFTYIFFLLDRTRIK
jgi:hypothetical protein